MNGTTTYTKSGKSITYSADGYPDFSPYQYNESGGKGLVEIDYTGDRIKDIKLANEKAGFAKTPEGYTWHHMEDAKSMQLVDRLIHDIFSHTGGFSIFKSKG